MYVQKHKFMFKSLITDSNEQRCIRYASLTCDCYIARVMTEEKYKNNDEILYNPVAEEW